MRKLAAVESSPDGAAGMGYLRPNGGSLQEEAGPVPHQPRDQWHVFHRSDKSDIYMSEAQGACRRIAGICKRENQEWGFGKPRSC